MLPDLSQLALTAHDGALTAHDGASIHASIDASIDAFQGRQTTEEGEKWGVRPLSESDELNRQRNNREDLIFARLGKKAKDWNLSFTASDREMRESVFRGAAELLGYQLERVMHSPLHGTTVSLEPGNPVTADFYPDVARDGLGYFRHMHECLRSIDAISAKAQTEAFPAIQTIDVKHSPEKFKLQYLKAGVSIEIFSPEDLGWATPKPKKKKTKCKAASTPGQALESFDDSDSEDDVPLSTLSRITRVRDEVTAYIKTVDNRENKEQGDPKVTNQITGTGDVQKKNMFVIIVYGYGTHPRDYVKTYAWREDAVAPPGTYRVPAILTGDDDRVVRKPDQAREKKFDTEEFKTGHRPWLYSSDRGELLKVYGAARQFVQNWMATPFGWKEYIIVNENTASRLRQYWYARMWIPEMMYDVVVTIEQTKQDKKDKKGIRLPFYCDNTRSGEFLAVVADALQDLRYAQSDACDPRSRGMAVESMLPIDVDRNDEMEAWMPTEEAAEMAKSLLWIEDEQGDADADLPEMKAMLKARREANAEAKAERNAAKKQKKEAAEAPVVEAEIVEEQRVGVRPELGTQT